jgi:hypothetical protein
MARTAARRARMQGGKGPTCLFRRSQRVVERRRVCVVENGYWPFLDSSVLYIMSVFVAARHGSGVLIPRRVCVVEIG